MFLCFFIQTHNYTTPPHQKYDPQIVSGNSNERLNFLPPLSQPHPFSRLGGNLSFFLYTHVLWTFTTYYGKSTAKTSVPIQINIVIH